MTETYPCPGHQGICPFCKGTEGKPRYIGNKVQMNRRYEIDTEAHRAYPVMEPVVDYCCHYCASNKNAGKKQYERTSLR